VRSPGTLRNRLALVALVATAGWVVALTLLFNLVLGAQLRGQADDVLRTRASAARATIKVAADGQLTVREPRNDAALDSGVWIYQGAKALDRPRAGVQVQRAADQLAAGPVPGFAEVGGPNRTRLYAEPVRHAGQRMGTVVTATNLEPYRRTSQAALVGSVSLAVLVLLGAYLATRRVVQRALEPVAEMAHQAAQWSAHDVGQRFGEAPRPGELRDLAASLDSLLDRIGAVLRHEQQLAGELSHELRTPLAVVAAENELLRDGRGSAAERARAHEVIAATTDRMAELLDTLLAQAAQHVSDAPGRCAVAPVLRAAVAGAATRDLDVDVTAEPGLEVGASAEVLERILAPVLGNAVRYAANRITVTASRRTPVVVISVVDDGPGVAEQFRAQVFEPGQRADPDDGHAGAGLGLALARRLARASGGDLMLRGSGPGAEFEITMPG
jgi:signal transduction histidine kinase